MYFNSSTSFYDNHSFFNSEVKDKVTVFKPKYLKLVSNIRAAENKNDLSRRTDQLLIYSIQIGKRSLGTVNSSPNSKFGEGLKFKTSQLGLILFYEETLIYFTRALGYVQKTWDMNLCLEVNVRNPRRCSPALSSICNEPHEK